MECSRTEKSDAASNSPTSWDWLPTAAPRIVSLDPRIAAPEVATPSAWRDAAEIRPFRITWPNVPPKSVSVPIRPTAVSTRSFAFPEPFQSNGGSPAFEASGASPAAPPATAAPNAADDPLRHLASVTRIHPPRDVIKLEDRLRYVLQPSLESFLGTRALAFPFQPFPYQLEGIAFLYPRHAAVLADEMGLGKTMQAITAVRLLLHSQEVRRVLLICPKPLVTNWHREFSLWAPEIPVAIIEGDQAKRRWQWQLPDVPVRIANYEAVQRDGEILQAIDPATGESSHFDLVILDESQRIKNRANITSQVVRTIARDRGWALTGTPVENSPEDLVGIFEFLSPGYLSSDMKPRRMGRAVQDFVLRRTKELVLKDLPPKLFRAADIELTSEQRESYQLAQDEGVLRLTEMGQSATIQHVFELVLRLKQICNFDPATGASAKLERLEADLEEVASSGRKAIIFSQWVETLQRLGKSLDRFGTLEYHGRIPTGKRDAVIEQFRNDRDKHVLLISYGAGGVGLNLQFAHYVFLFDRWWNPAIEDQAINRAHRIGVSGPVTVTRFLALDTIEERIDRVLQEKRDIFDAIFSDQETNHRLGLTQREIFGLFNLVSPAGPIRVAA
jgi:SNF2 family DNA or RNA helicase